jgi:hypothetical protein
VSKKSENQLRIAELESEVCGLRREVDELKSALPKPGLLDDGWYRGTIAEAEECLTSNGRRIVRIKIANIDGFPLNQLWHYFSTARQASPYESVCLDLGVRVPNRPAQEYPGPIPDPKQLVGKRVTFAVRTREWAGQERSEITSIRRTRR